MNRSLQQANDAPVSLSLGKRLWNPAAAVYLGFTVAGLAAGLFADWIYVPKWAPPSAPLPTLQCLTVAQVGFLLLALPLIVCTRLDAPRRTTPPIWIAEFILWMTASVPLYLAAGYVADATAGDVLRSAAVVTAIWPLGLALGRLLRHRRFQPTILLLTLLLTIGGPAIWYILVDFAPGVDREWVWNLGPVTFAWTNAASRSDDLLPRPLWAWLVCPVAGGLAFTLESALTPRSRTLSQEQ